MGMTSFSSRNTFVISFVLHVGILFLFILGFELASPLPVIENTNKNDTISAVVLGDISKSKILPQPPAAPVIPKKEKPLPPLPILTKKPPAEALQKDVVALKVDEKKKLAEKKIVAEKNQQELIAKDLLADIKKMDAEKKLKQKELQAHFQKTLREQAEKTMRQQLLDEDIKLAGQQKRDAQGIVNKYQALILQAISENWIIPSQVNKKLYCELMIRLAPGGNVLDVQVTKTSGDPSLDSSARAAVMKASPLPVPSDPIAFKSFREFILKVKPENILANT